MRRIDDYDVHRGYVIVSPGGIFEPPRSTVWTGGKWLHALWTDRCELDKNLEFAGDLRDF
jgi:hypothetical protein